MIRSFFLLLLLLVVPLHAQTIQVSGSWREIGLIWSKPPADLHLKERSAEAGILYFGPDGQFALVYGIVIQGPNSEALSQGDGRAVYLGTWKRDGGILQVEYRLVSRTVRKQGEALPGPIEKKTLRLKGRLMHFEKMRFARDKRLDDQLLAVIQGERARQGNTGQP